MQSFVLFSWCAPPSIRRENLDDNNGERTTTGRSKSWRLSEHFFNAMQQDTDIYIVDDAPSLGRFQLRRKKGRKSDRKRERERVTKETASPFSPSSRVRARYVSCVERKSHATQFRVRRARGSGAHEHDACPVVVEDALRGLRAQSRTKVHGRETSAAIAPLLSAQLDLDDLTYRKQSKCLTPIILQLTSERSSKWRFKSVTDQGPFLIDWLVLMAKLLITSFTSIVGEILGWHCQLTYGQLSITSALHLAVSCCDWFHFRILLQFELVKQ